MTKRQEIAMMRGIRRRTEKPEKVPKSVRIIQDAVCEVYEIDRDQLLSYAKPSHVSAARQAAMALSREFTGFAYERIGESFQRNHGTVIDAVQSIENRTATDRKFAANYNDLRKYVAEKLAELHLKKPQAPI